MSEQIFISYRRDGGDIYAKAICEALKVRGYSVFYDSDSIHSGCFESRIYQAIDECNDFVLVLSPNALDRCINERDTLRLEIRHALKCGKNIIPLLLPGFLFPKNIPADIAEVIRFNGVIFIMEYFDAVIDALIKHFASSLSNQQTNASDTPSASSPISASANIPNEPDEASTVFNDIMDILRRRQTQGGSDK